MGLTILTFISHLVELTTVGDYLNELVENCIVYFTQIDLRYLISQSKMMRTAMVFMVLILKFDFYQVLTFTDNLHDKDERQYVELNWIGLLLFALF